MINKLKGKLSTDSMIYEINLKFKKGKRKGKKQMKDKVWSNRTRHVINVWENEPASRLLT